MNLTEGAVEVEAGELVRHRHYRTAARLLKEYTDKLHLISHRIGVHLDKSESPSSAEAAPWECAAGISHFESISQPVSDVALFASQMLVHYQLDEVASAELSLRLAETEQAIRFTRSICETLTERYPYLSKRKAVLKYPPQVTSRHG